MTRIEEIQREVLELARRFTSFSGRAGDWSRALVNVWNNENLSISAESPYLSSISELSRLELLQLIVNGEPERLAMVDHSQEWCWLKDWTMEWERERERANSSRRWP